jgi:hypothetical protein
MSVPLLEIIAVVNALNEAGFDEWAVEKVKSFYANKHGITDEQLEKMLRDKSQSLIDIPFEEDMDEQ